MDLKRRISGFFNPNTSTDYAIFLGVTASIIAIPAGAPLVVLGAAAAGYALPKIMDSAFGETLQNGFEQFMEKTGISKAARDKFGTEKLKASEIRIAMEALERGNPAEKVFGKLDYASAEEVIRAVDASQYRNWIPEAQLQELNTYRERFQQENTPIHSPQAASAHDSLSPMHTPGSPSQHTDIRM